MWITLSADDLNEYLPAQQLRAMRTKALASGQSDPVTAMITEVTTQVRTMIASAGFALEATDGSFPDSLRTAVAYMVIALAQARLPGLSLTNEQNAQIADAKALMMAVAAGKFAIEAPEVPDTTLVPSTGTIQTVHARHRRDRIDAKDLRGL